MTAIEVLAQTWAAVASEYPPDSGFYQRRIPMNSFLPMHAGISRPSNARILVLEVEKKSIRGRKLRDETKGYKIDVIGDTFGHQDRASIQIVELPSGSSGIFETFCADIVTCWTGKETPSDAVSALLTRLDRWKAFFGRYTGLSREEYIGLFGELSFIRKGIKSGIPAQQMVESWLGMRKTNQDFLFGKSAVEIKTTTANDLNRIRITNTRQLDTAGLDSLYLWRWAFDFRHGSGERLRTLIDELKTLIASVDVASTFSERLLESGFLEATPYEFDDWGFTPRKHDVFAVSDDFPRLLESDLKGGVCDVIYSIDLSAADDHKVLENEFWSKEIA